MERVCGSGATWDVCSVTPLLTQLNSSTKALLLLVNLKRETENHPRKGRASYGEQGAAGARSRLEISRSLPM